MGVLPYGGTTRKNFMNRRIRKTVRMVVWEDGGGDSASDPMSSGFLEKGAFFVEGTYSGSTR
ncbi:MAG: hypothetical protein K940chlam2_00583 [Chlamydiae bacterium]|nr:hypothetical protein [Chlamydiota bacterium]